MMQLAIAIAALTTFPLEGFAATSQKQDALPKGLIRRNSNGDSDTLPQGSAVPAPTYGLMRGKKNKKDVQLHIDENGVQKIGSEAGAKQDTKEGSLIQKIQDPPAKKEEAQTEEAQTEGETEIEALQKSEGEALMMKRKTEGTSGKENKGGTEAKTTANAEQETEDSECEDLFPEDFRTLCTTIACKFNLVSVRREWCNRMKEASADLRTQLEVSDCQDDCDWYKNGEKGKNCAWIKESPQHCLRMRSGGRKVLAADACCDACKCTKVLQELDCGQYKDAEIYDSITDKDLISNTNHWYKDMSIGELGLDKIDQTVEKLLGDLSSHLKSKTKSELEKAGRDATIMKEFWDKTGGVQDSEDCDSGETCARALYTKAFKISQCFAAMVAASRCMEDKWHDYSDGCRTTITTTKRQGYQSPGFAIAPAPSEGCVDNPSGKVKLARADEEKDCGDKSTKKVCAKLVEEHRRRRRDADIMKVACKKTCRDYLEEKGKLKSETEKSRMESELPGCSAPGEREE